MRRFSEVRDALGRTVLRMSVGQIAQQFVAVESGPVPVTELESAGRNCRSVPRRERLRRRNVSGPLRRTGCQKCPAPPAFLRWGRPRAGDHRTERIPSRRSSGWRLQIQPVEYRPACAWPSASSNQSGSRAAQKIIPGAWVQPPHSLPNGPISLRPTSQTLPLLICSRTSRSRHCGATRFQVRILKTSSHAKPILHRVRYRDLGIRDESPTIARLFQIDRDRIIHAHAFRKLQSKTQVFLSGEYDFYRTRLTHSMECRTDRPFHLQLSAHTRRASQRRGFH
jgi:hypothetical protein